MPGVGGLGNPIVLKARRLLHGGRLPGSGSQKVAQQLDVLQKEELGYKKHIHYQALAKSLAAEAARVQGKHEELVEEFLPETAWRCQTEQDGTFVFLNCGADSLLRLSLEIAPPDKEKIQRLTIMPGEPAFAQLSVPSNVESLVLTWSYGDKKHVETIGLARGKTARLRQVDPRNAASQKQR